MSDNPKKLSKKARKQAKKKKGNVCIQSFRRREFDCLANAPILFQAERDSPALNVAKQLLKRVFTRKFQLPAARAIDNERCFGGGRGCIGIRMASVHLKCVAFSRLFTDILTTCCIYLE